MHRTRSLLAMMFALVLGAGVLSACGKPDEGTTGERAQPASEEAFREGLAEELDGLEYNVFLTRQLNLNLPEDSAYYDGPAAPAGSALYGVFLEVCNRGQEGKAFRSAESFKITDTQGNEFEPIDLPENNPFAYNPELLEPRECIPARGSVPQLGPTGGALVLFELTQEATENRPLELEIEGTDAIVGEREALTFELDI